MPRQKYTYEQLLEIVKGNIQAAGGEIPHNALVSALPSEAALKLRDMVQSGHIQAAVKSTPKQGERAVLVYSLVGGE